MSTVILLESKFYRDRMLFFFLNTSLCKAYEVLAFKCNSYGNDHHINIDAVSVQSGTISHEDDDPEGGNVT
jgi:hypothetical protein